MLGYFAALLAIAVLSAVVGLVVGSVDVANVSMLYLVAVLAIAIVFGRGPAVVASVAALVTFNWFFVEPTHTLTVADPDGWIALLLFLTTAVITSQLAADQRRQALEAQEREREASVLYDVVRLMGEADLERALGAVAERLRRELQLEAVEIEMRDGELVSARVVVGDSEEMARASAAATGHAWMLGEGTAPSSARRGAPGRWIRIVPPTTGRSAAGSAGKSPTQLHAVPIRVANRRVGALLVVRPSWSAAFTSVDDRLLSAVAIQLGLAVERARLRREATEAEILRRTDELKTVLLNAVSHDLRTPLSSIIAGAESLLQRDVDWTEGDRREFAEAIRNEALRLNRIVGNLLDLSRIEAGSLRPQKGWYDLRALVDDVLGRLRPVTARHPVVVDVSENLPPVELDYVEIDQVISNLIENAVKHTPAESPIEIAAHPVGREMWIEVADRGPGISEAALPRLFDAFYRAKTSSPRSKGTGLGLAVARGLVEAHGGRIWAENREGGGARFVFSLPLHDAPALGGTKPAVKEEEASS